MIGKCGCCDKRRVMFATEVVHQGARSRYGGWKYCRPCFKRIVGRDPKPNERWQ